MKHIYKLVLALTSVVSMGSCNRDLFDDDLFRTGEQITFSTDLLLSRANPSTEEGNNDYTTLGVYSAITAAEWNASDALDNSWKNQLLTRTKGSAGWTYTPSKPWTNNRHSFFAYAPHNAAGLSVTANVGVPSMQFTVSDVPANQIDLLVAEAAYNRTDTTAGDVLLRMRHALTRVVFSAKLGNSVNSNTEIHLTKIELSHLRNRAIRPMDFRPSDGWSGLSGDKTYSLLNDGIQLDDQPLTQTLRPMTLEEGNLYLLPQDFSASSTVELIVTYETFVNGVSTEVKRLTTKMSDILDEWLPGEAIRYVLTIPNPAQPGLFTVGIEHIPWDNVDIDAAIDADPYLDISNITLSTFDAAATRLYYYTNLPADSVSVVHVGNVGTKNGYPFALRDEFYAITADDADGHFNFHPPVGGKGYIDLINRKTTTAGDRPNNGKNQLVIRLRAGKLVRDVTIQPVVSVEAAKQNTVPYVGTFHRMKEVGERIVTWHLPPNVEWEATIVDEPLSDHAELCIDRLASPDYANNILYSLSPRDSEGTMVDPAQRSLKGKGRIYFRVGWKSTIRTGNNRYARIEVKVTGGATHYIYCRQGEQEERITNLATSLFAVYNTAQPRDMVQYPSQVGMLYQWNRTKPWDPLSKSAPPGFPLDYETSFSYDRNVCPEGYLYPSTVELGEMKQIINNRLFRWGYYADGFFDRRAITPGQHRVEANSLSVASAGFLFFSPAVGGLAPRSIFLTTGGDRITGGELINPGLQGGYWSDVTGADNSLAQIGYFVSDGATNYDGTSADDLHGKNHALSIRCVSPPVGTAFIVRFDANGGENAPSSVTMPSSKGTITLPGAVPNNHWRNGYIFVGWNSDRAGTSPTTYQPGDVYTPVALTPAVNTLYAKWAKDPFTTIDFRQYSGASDCIMSGLITSYANLTRVSNGGYHTLLVNLKLNEKAYPALKWSEQITPPTDWITAYDYCKNTYKGADSAPGAWRLPRGLEVYLVSTYSPVEELKDQFGKYLWSATELTPTTSWLHEYGFASKSKSELFSFRCVKEISPLP